MTGALFIFQTPAAVNKIKEILAQRADCVSMQNARLLNITSNVILYVISGK
jgi:hypothetical protein